MCESNELENGNVGTIEQAAAILGEAAIVRHPDNPSDHDLTNAYGPPLPPGH